MAEAKLAEYFICSTSIFPFRTGEVIDVSIALVEDRSRIAKIAAFERARQSGIQTPGGSTGQDGAAVILSLLVALTLVRSRVGNEP